MAMTNSYVLCSTFVGILCFAIIPEVLASTRAPYFIKEPTDTYVQRGKSAVLDCLVGGSLKAAITWRKNGIALRDLSQDDRRMIKPDGSLYFSKVNHDTAENSDEGAYQCEALTRNDMNLDFQILSRTARLLVAEISSKVAVTPSKLKVSFGDTSRFHCYVNDSTPKAVVRWRKLGENHFIESKGRFTITFDGALQIAESRFDDQGDYECTAENTVTETSHTSTLTASLEVTTDSGFPRGPYVSVASVERKYIAGDIVILDCIANGFPKPKVTWLFDGLPVVLGSGYSVVGQNNLMIESVTEEHAGTYTCRAISRNGIGEATTKLEVHHPPLFIKKPDNVHAYVDSNALFECFADGIPKPVITWSRNGDVIEESLYNVIGDGYLLVKGLVLSDMGPYQCFAENHLGKIQATAELNVYMKGQPLPSLQTTTAPNTERAEKPISASVSDTKTEQNTASASYNTVEPETRVASESSTNSSMTTTLVATVVPVTESISDISTAQVTTAAPDSTPATDSTVDVHSSAVSDPTVTSDTTKLSVMTDALQGSSAVPYTPSAMSTIASFGTSPYPVKTATNKIATNQDTTSIPNSTASSAEPKTLASMETLDTTVAKPDLITLIHGTSGTPASTTVADSIPETTDATKHPYSTAAKDTASTVEATNTETVTVENKFTTAIREVITTSDATELPHTPTREITAFPKATSDFKTEPDPDVTAPPVITTTPDVQHRDELQPIVKEKTVREGSIKVIKCIATAIHKPDVDWYRNGKKLPTMKCSELNDVRCQGIPYEVYEEIKEHKLGGKSARTIKVLKIRSALYSRDQGEFECIATNGHAQPAKLIIDLNVLAPPRLLQKPDKVLSSSGKGSKVSCVVNKGNPLPTFNWEYQNTDCFTFNTSSCDPVESQWMPVPESLIMTPPNTPTKKSVVNVQGNQPTASFRCLASNKLGRDFHVIKLVRSVPLAFVKKPQNILKGYLGQKILINCSTNDQDATVSLLYRRHPFVAFVKLKLEEKKLLKKGQAFELLNVGLRDSGFYACEAKNEANDKIRWPPGTGYLILNEEPLEFLNQPPVIIRGYLGQNLVINCSTNDQEATVSLLYKHHPLTSFHELDLKQNKLSRKGKVFALLNVERRDAGIYSCQASNRGGWNIRWPPGRGYLIPIRGGLANHFVLRPKTPLTVRQGQQMTITCESEGISETKLHWMKQTKKGDVSVPSNLVTVDRDRSTNKVRAFLKISNVQAEDAGVYKCVLRVFDKTDHKTISLYVREPLSFLVKPDVILHGYQAHSLTLNCSTNDRNATVSLYHRHHPLAPFRERKIDAKKVLLKGQVFKLLNLSLKDQGTYACEAKTEENESIRWPSTRGYLIVSQARIPDYFELKPANPITVPKGGSTIVTCESEGVSEIQLQWKKGDVSNGNASIQDRMVSIVKDWSTNRVQAILRITNAQMEDSGVYQCVLRVFEKTSMKSVEITVSHN